MVCQPEPMVGDTLDLVEIVPLISDSPVLHEEFVNVLAMTVGPSLENLRVLVLKLLVLQPLLSLRPHNGLELVADQVDPAVEVRGQVHERLDTLLLNVLNDTDGIFLHERNLRSQRLHVVLKTFRLCQEC